MERQMYKRSIFNVLRSNVPGAREYVALLFVVLGVFFISVLLSGYLFIKAIQVGEYAERVIAGHAAIIIVSWALLWVVSFLYAVRSSLKISYSVAGPIKRVERLLDEILNGKDVEITIRDGDALSGIVKRITRLLEALKSEKLAEQKNVYEQYQQKMKDLQQKNRDLPA